MKTTAAYFLFAIGVITGCADNKTITIFNGKDLGGWDTYIGPSFDTIQGKRDSIAAGLNNDPLKVFTVVTEDGSSALRISGERYGGISTTREYGNYHLTLEFKWGQKKWPPWPGKKRDSGILYHAVGPHGADSKFWMRSQELQIQEGDCGDYWGCAGAIFDVHARRKDSTAFIYDPAGELFTFSAAHPNGRHCIKSPDSEKESGAWNTLELYCLGDTSIHVVNGVVCMVLYNSRQRDGESENPLKEGKIQIQSEGAEVFYRNITLTPIAEIADRLLLTNKL